MSHYLNKFLKFLFLFLIIKPVVYLIVGLNIRHRERLPLKGPLIVVANHNSHLDTLVLMSLFPNQLFTKIRPVAAVDYFFKNRFLKWFSTEIIGIIPIARQKAVSVKADPLSPIYKSLDNNDIVIIFPEGSRGNPEERQSFKRGISHIAEKCKHVPIIPIFLYGLGKSLPRGECILVPFFCDVFIGEKLPNGETRQEFMKILEETFDNLAHEAKLK